MRTIKTKEIKVSKHCQYRGKQRVNVRGKSFVHLAIKAFNYGIGYFDTKDHQLKKYLNRKYKNKHKANNIRVYGHFVYMFRDNHLLTVIDLPEYLWCKWDSYSRKIKAKAI